MDFYGYFRSSTAYRTRIALYLKGVDFDFLPVHLTRNGGEQRQEKYQSLNPQGLVPTIVDGEFVLTQSLAIIEWLEEKYPKPSILPGNAEIRAKIRAFAYAIACEIHPLQNLRVLRYLEANFDQDQNGKNDWCHHWISEGLNACEKLLVNQGHNSAFCYGDTPSLADICLVPQVFSAGRFGVDMAHFPTLKAIHSRCNELPAFQKALPQNQPDFEPA